MRFIFTLVLVQLRFFTFGFESPGARSLKSPPPAAGDTIFLEVDHSAITYSSGVYYLDVPIYMTAVSDAFSFDLWFKFNEAKMTYSSTIANVSELDPTSNFSDINSFLSNSTSGPSISYQMPLNTDLITLRFVLAEATTIIEAADIFQINSLIDGVVCNNKVVFKNNSSSIEDLGKMEEEECTVFPNPTKGLISYNRPIGSNVILRDSSGKRVSILSSIIEKDVEQVNLEYLDNGIYFLTIDEKTFKLILDK
jgi:hypothetical protein